MHILMTKEHKENMNFYKPDNELCVKRVGTTRRCFGLFGLHKIVKVYYLSKKSTFYRFLCKLLKSK